MKNESDEEREQRKVRKATNRKVKSEAPSGDEGINTPLGGGGNDGEPKKKRRKLKKTGGVASAAASTQPSDAEDGGALFSEGEEEKPLKKVPFTFLVSLGALLMTRLLTSVEQRESVLHEKRTTSQPLRPVKSNSKFLNA